MKTFFTKAVCTLALTIGLTAVQAQPGVTWEKNNYWDAGSWFYDVQATTDGGAIATGWKDNDNHVFVVKTDKNGNEQWRYFPALLGITKWKGTSIIKTSDGGYLVAGTIWLAASSSGNYNGYVVKLNSSGTKLWDKIIAPGPFTDLTSVREDPSIHSLIIAGAAKDETNNRYESFLKLISSTGGDIWDTFGKNVVSGIKAVGAIPTTVNPAFGFMYFFNNNNGANYFGHWPITSSGTIVNVTYFTNYGDAGVENVTLNTGSFTPMSTNNGFAYIVQYETVTSGTQIRLKRFSYDTSVKKYFLSVDKTYGGLGNETMRLGHAIKETSDKGIIFIATSTSTGASGHHGGEDAWLVKTDISGNIQWQKFIGTTGNEKGISVDQTTDGGYIVAGEKAGKAWLVKLGGTLGTQEATIKATSVYPNPAKDILHVSSSKEITGAYIQGVTGQLLGEASKDGGKTYQVSKLTPGVYFLILSYTDGNKEAVKFIKE